MILRIPPFFIWKNLGNYIRWLWQKVTGTQRAQVEVFRGALRPFTTTVNQELSDVLKSKIRLFTIFPGTVAGGEPNNEKIEDAINFLVSENAASSSEVTFCVDESR